MNITFGERVRRARIGSALSQAELGSKLGVSQAAVSSWEQGRVVPRPEQKAGLKRVLGDSLFDQDEGGAAPISRPIESSVGAWLTAAREKAGLSVYELAAKAGISGTAIYNIEQGRIARPRPDTLRKLGEVLKAEMSPKTVSEADQAELSGLGVFDGFDPYKDSDLPSTPGLYVLYDISERPIYVGEGPDIKERIREDQEEFWFRRPIVETAAYVAIPNKSLREKIERLFLGFMKATIVMNALRPRQARKKEGSRRVRSSATARKIGDAALQLGVAGMTLGSGATFLA